ncbi:hypothetical protein RSAG8_11627, partial [Rhizoctonia solani AG-8 WAC10335]
MRATRAIRVSIRCWHWKLKTPWSACYSSLGSPSPSTHLSICQTVCHRSLVWIENLGILSGNAKDCERVLFRRWSWFPKSHRLYPHRRDGRRRKGRVHSKRTAASTNKAAGGDDEDEEQKYMLCRAFPFAFLTARGDGYVLHSTSELIVYRFKRYHVNAFDSLGLCVDKMRKSSTFL